MGCFVANATPEMVYSVSKNMRDRDLQEILAVCWEQDREQLAQGLAQRYGEMPFCFCIGKDDVSIAVLAGIACHPGVWAIGMWATPDFDQVGAFMTRWALKHFFPAMQKAGLHRLECKSIVGYSEVHEWLRYLGFHEGNTEKMYGKNGEDFITFYWHEGAPIGKRLGKSR